MLLLPVIGRGYGDWVVYIHIGVGSALLVSTNRAMRRPQRVRRATGTGSHAFLIYIGYIQTAESGELIGNREQPIYLLTYKFYAYETRKKSFAHGGYATM